MLRRRPATPDSALLAQVTDANEVSLGTYAEDVLAVTGAYPARGGLDPQAQHASSFRALDGAARKAAMQAALDRLTGDGTLAVQPGSSLESVVRAGLDGKLDLTGPLADLYQLGYWFRRHGFRSGLVVSMQVSPGLTGAPMPPGVPPPGLETCFSVPSPEPTGMPILLVERIDAHASARTYTVRTLRQEFVRMAAFLFAEMTGDGEMLRAEADMVFRFGERLIKAENEFVRTVSEDVAQGRLRTQIPKRRKQQEPRFVQVTAAEMPDAMIRLFTSGAARTQ